MCTFQSPYEDYVLLDGHEAGLDNCMKKCSLAPCNEYSPLLHNQNVEISCAYEVHYGCHMFYDNYNKYIFVLVCSYNYCVVMEEGIEKINEYKYNTDNNMYTLHTPVFIIPL